MAFERPTLTQLVDRISSDFTTRITGAGTLLRRSTLKVIARVVAGACHLMYGFLNFIADQLFASSAETTYLDRIASEYGIVRIAGVRASGQGTVTGTTGISIPINTILQSSAGNKYFTTGAVTLVAGSATLSLQAEVAGEDYNDEPAIDLTFLSPISGVSTTCTVDGNGLTGGLDEESDAGLRARVLSRKRLPPHGGADHDYITWAKEVSGVTRAWCLPLYAGDGTVALAFVRDDDTPIIPDAGERSAVESYIIEHTDPGTGLTVGIPVTAEPGFSIITLTALTMDFEIDIYPNNSVIQAAIQAEIEDLIEREGGPGETIYLSQIQQAISNALDEEYHRLDSPAADVTATQTQVHIMGTISWGDY
jgi:uncharacterized phage protein gp47/JayE